MHYKNNRPVSLKDWVIGPSHNSEGKLIIGVVAEIMPKQGPCNVRLETFPSFRFHALGPNDDSHGVRVEVTDGDKNEVQYIGSHRDYADANELLRVDDAFRAARAIEDFGRWEGGAFSQQLQ